MFNITVNLRKKVKRIGIIFFFILLIVPYTYSQVNSEIGYTISYFPLKTTNTIIDLYNKGANLGEEETVLKSIKPMHFLNGFNVGLSYRFGGLKVGGFWNNMSANRIGTRGNVKNNIGNEKSIYLNVNTISFGTELLVNYIGIGASLDYNMSSIKTKLNNNSSKVLLSNDTKYAFYSNKVYLILYLRATDRFAIELKPYISFPWQRQDVSELDNYFDLSKPNEPRNEYKSEKMIQFGLTFSILNGFQPEF